MKLNAGVKFVENGMTTALRAMHVQSEIVGMINENVSGFDKVGYQRKEIVTSAFTEFLGVHGLSTTVDDKIGRLTNTSNPLDLALANKGYFQTQSKDGVRLTRDGRFKLDKEGNLLTLDDSKVLANNGMPIKLSIIPENLENIKINAKGGISVYNKETNKMDYVATIGAVDANGLVVMDPQVKQGYNEYSNVALEREFLGMMPVLRSFEANRQIFMIESSNLTKTISQLGSAS